MGASGVAGEKQKQPINNFIMPFNTYKQTINTIRRGVAGETTANEHAGKPFKEIVRAVIGGS